MLLKTISIIIPNNDFLQNEDTNKVLKDLSKLIEGINHLGFEIPKVSVIQEDEQVIAKELSLFSSLYHMVLIIANEKPFCISRALTRLISQEAIPERTVLNHEVKWPKSVKFLPHENTKNAVVYFQRIFILALNHIDEQLVNFLEPHLRHYRKTNIYSKTFRFTNNDNYRLPLENFHFDHVDVTFESDKVLTLHSGNLENIIDTENIIRNKFGSEDVTGKWINYMKEMVYNCNDKHIKDAIQIIEQCIEEYDIENIFLSFNGGKDCTVLLHLVMTVLEMKFPEQMEKTKLFCLYVMNENAFPEQNAFIQQCIMYFNLEVMYVTTNIKDALKIILDKKPQFKACFMGTRRTDPFSLDLKPFQKTDQSWPQIMRCNPLLDWFYSDIWDYLLFYKVPYCKLYDYGFTSLGNVSNTIRNPMLLINEDEKNEENYLPAYKLFNEKFERCGRNISKI